MSDVLSIIICALAGGITGYCISKLMRKKDKCYVVFKAYKDNGFYKWRMYDCEGRFLGYCQINYTDISQVLDDTKHLEKYGILLAKNLN